MCKKVYKGVVHNVARCLRVAASFVTAAVIVLLSSYVTLMLNAMCSAALYLTILLQGMVGRENLVWLV